MIVLVLGCGALGSRIAIDLPGHELWLFDRDRVERDNIPTSAYSIEHVGMMKVAALAEMCYRRGIEVVRTDYREFGADYNVREMPGLVVCTLDNTEGRRAATSLFPAPILLQAGVSSYLVGCVARGDRFPILSSADPDENPVCTHMLGLPILAATAFVAAQAVRAWEHFSGLRWVDAYGAVGR